MTQHKYDKILGPVKAIMDASSKTVLFRIELLLVCLAPYIVNQSGSPHCGIPDFPKPFEKNPVPNGFLKDGHGSRNIILWRIFINPTF